MKKKNFLYTGTLALGMFMSGCSDSFLDMNNYGAYDDFNSETKITGIWPDYIRQVLKTIHLRRRSIWDCILLMRRILTNSRMRCGESRLPAGLTRVRNIRPLMI